MKRKDVYKEIDIEIEYANKKWVEKNLNNGIVDKKQALKEWIQYIDTYLSYARDYDYFGEYDEALGELRKVVALGVTALEIYGCPSRIKNNNDLQNLDGDGC